jgi:DNA mismatch repair ATPase MutS
VARRAAVSQNPEVQFFLNALVPLDAYNAYQLSQYKTQILRQLPAWLDVWFELEALCSLTNFAYLNPGYTFPRLIAQQTPVFEAQALGHPLIPEEQKVVNDFALQQTNEIVLITGSNMAGKSTFLRTLGINLCLAYAGAPVNAANLRTSLFEVYACIKVSDSLADGYSYFYAEVRRLQRLLERIKEDKPLSIFFLIDEIFKGTNNDERLIGSSAYIHALAGQNCAGAISTHDLELVKLSESLPMLKNFHFREDVQNGQMVFDYKLHDGPCPTRNALKIMQLAGLPISWEGQSVETASTQ